jgi:hypothetical protein
MACVFNVAFDKTVSAHHKHNHHYNDRHHSDLEPFLFGLVVGLICQEENNETYDETYCEYVSGDDEFVPTISRKTFEFYDLHYADYNSVIWYARKFEDYRWCYAQDLNNPNIWHDFETGYDYNSHTGKYRNSHTGFYWDPYRGRLSHPRYHRLSYDPITKRFYKKI